MIMSINGSDKERTFTFYQKFKNDVMSDVLGFKFENIKLEKPFGKNKVDLFAIDPNRKLEIYVENQMTPSDDAHLNKVINLINGTNEGIIVWMSLRFNERHLNSIEKELKRNKQKYIDFYAVTIAPNVVDYVAWLDRQFKIHILNNLGIINQVKNPMKVVYKLEQIPKTFVGNAFVGNRNYNFDRIEDLREYILEKLQEKIPYFPNLHYGKRTNKYGKSIYIGAGKAGLTYIISVKNGNEKAVVELHFDKSEANLFKAFVLHKDSMQLQIHPTIKFRERKIGVYFEPFQDLNDTIDLIADILDKMIKYFSPYTYAKI
jgi:hypothetical protein